MKSSTAISIFRFKESETELRGIEDRKPISMYLIDMHTPDRRDDGLGSWQGI
jgi:hypothetical protein